MDKPEFAKLVASMQVEQYANVNGGPSLRIVYPDISITGANSQESLFKEKGRYLATCFNSILRQLAKQVGYEGDVEEFCLKTNQDVRRHIVKSDECTQDKDGVYIPKQRVYNVNGLKKRTTGLKKGHTQAMENRKIKLTLITLVSGAALTLQITAANKDATAWTNFIDADNSPKEYDNGVWTKDVASQNKSAVEAVDKMIQIEKDFQDNKLDKEQALEDFQAAYVEWVKAHLTTNPDFVERRILGLNCENPMADYLDVEEADADDVK